ncbi:hypothetical protein E1265_13670 [Streptomyces sp. 8K308]|uniref:hypothetical protein n=1 Tax=Streptomyces sp. 8K308 TaxID=2530388 RepID=UPI0010491A42|nr:hypothetical protein [Streptomyces sp. 8K308]TDC23143.1 hypothetical protein E1265_13670 [Streptomyces sp. 8K308]
MARHTSSSGSGVFVSVLTVAALAVVAFFAYQASAADDGPPLASEQPDESASPEDDATDGGEDAEAEEPPLPAESGTGRRVVYALGQQRVWLVDVAQDGTGEVVLDTFPVYPSSVSPEPGEYAVTSRTPSGTGSDGVAIEHTVIFHSEGDVVFGFSAAIDGSTPDPQATQRTGAVRESREDGAAMWEFATENVAVVVVP